MTRDLDADYMGDVLSFDPLSGVFTWKHRRPEMFSSGAETPSHTCAKWNGRNAGREAFTYKNRDGYRHTNIGGKKVFAHRAAWAIHFGEWPSGQLDHINGDKSDNRIENLRIATNSQNGMNRGAQSNNTSGVKGVCLHKASGLWHCSIMRGGKRKSLGYFRDLDAARSAYNDASLKMSGEFHRGI